MDIRDHRGRALRLVTSFGFAVLVGFACSAMATHIPAGPYDRPVAREWFILATGLFAWLICFLSALGFQTAREKQQWYAALRR